MKEAFRKREKQTSILIYVENQTINEEAVNHLIENIPKMDQSNLHLAVKLFDHLSPELALTYRNQLEGYIDKALWSLYEQIVNGTEKEVMILYRKTIQDLDRVNTFQHDLYIQAKKLASSLVQRGWITKTDIDRTMKKESNEKWFSFEGILTVYMIGLLKLDTYIPLLAGLLDRDDDLLLEEVSVALIGFQSDEVVKVVEPFLKKQDSIIYATSVVENIKTDFAVQVLINAYQVTEEIEDQDLLIEALCHQLSMEALPTIREHMKKEYTSSLVEMEQAVYSYYRILGEDHPELDVWRRAALEMGLVEFQDAVTNVNGNKVGRNDPCPCGSGKKYKKCCGK
ncbi:YecA family protein [Neobacillus jeddahensis]|uniref:YecA family protein n=1 Tax=Neobacillus jeddahensis TaxID=1461580 RepID=UPI001FCC4181|nr:SEC-C metal-binding domain-containing protein [Neobacillus jeddahensis]